MMLFRAGVDSVFALLGLGCEGSSCPLEEADELCLAMIDGELCLFVIGLWCLNTWVVKG